jgi:hypothetical protein
VEDPIENLIFAGSQISSGRKKGNHIQYKAK